MTKRQKVEDLLLACIASPFNVPSHYDRLLGRLKVRYSDGGEPKPGCVLLNCFFTVVMPGGHTERLLVYLPFGALAAFFACDESRLAAAGSGWFCEETLALIASARAMKGFDSVLKKR